MVGVIRRPHHQSGLGDRGWDERAVGGDHGGQVAQLRQEVRQETGGLFGGGHLDGRAAAHQILQGAGYDGVEAREVYAVVRVDVEQAVGPDSDEADGHCVDGFAVDADHRPYDESAGGVVAGGVEADLGRAVGGRVRPNAWRSG